jgi:hypothetical protein
MQLRLALVLAFMAAPAFARPLEDELPVHSAACWQRTYDAAHLKAHPKQKVARIRLAHTGGEADGTLYLALDINLRKRANYGAFDYVLGGYCKPDGAALTCVPEWDAGSFTIEKGPKQTLLVRNHHMVVNPSNYDSEDIADNAVDLSRTDDAVWLLKPVYPENCERH